MTALDLSVITHNLNYLLVKGLGLTIELTMICAAAGLVLGGVLAVLRLYGPAWLRLSVAAYVNLIRSIPLLLVIFWFYFLVPYVIAWVTRAPNPVQLNAFVSAMVTFTLFEACYYCEILRAGLQSISTGQKFAAQALGLSQIDVMRCVLLPQALKSVTPILMLQIIVLFQDISLVYVLSLTDFVGAATQLAQQQNRLVEVYLFVALVYFVICFSATKGIRHLQLRLANQ